MAGTVAGWLRRGFLPAPAWYLLLGGLTLAGAVAYSFLPVDPAPRAQAFLALQLSLGAVALGALLVRPRSAVPLGWVLAVGLLARLATLPSELIFENDVFRYLWDARVSAAGINPYRYPPAAEALQSLQDDWVFPQIPYRQVPTIYPPLAQVVFLASRSLFGEAVEGLQLTMIAFEMGTLVLLSILGARLGAPRAAAAYALHPLALKEFAQGAHIDAAAVFFLALAVLLLLSQKRLGAMAALGAAALVKVFPLVLLPLLVRRAGAFRAGVFLLAIALPLGLVALGGASPLAGLGVFARFWIFNPSVYDLVARALAVATTPEAAHTYARPICGVALGATALAIALRIKAGDDRGLVRAMAATVMALLLFSPAANPWYVAWLLPLALCARWWPALAWTLTASLSYSFYLAGQDAPGWRLLEYLPVAAILAVDWARSRGKRAAEPAARTRKVTLEDHGVSSGP
ncbi:MAG: DUF2029 domain-containing protein [Myxococcales bacterium]|nr:DUF2029 domain-containing protein [Myxococcales bacterium]